MSFDTHYVVFLDLLGFSEMVKHDSEHAEENRRFFQKLYEVFFKTKELASEGPFNIVQFSDSITISAKYERGIFSSLLDFVSNFQFDLFQSGILIRGGISLGKHFYEDGFLFSQGLINAYHLESKAAKYPRIVVSTDLLNLIYPDGKMENGDCLLKENDELYFVDFLKNKHKVQCEACFKTLLELNGRAQSPSVLDKHNWLRDYIKFKFPDSTLQNSRFFNL